MKLTRKQQQFVAEYLIDLNAKQAAIRAGYSPNVAETNGPRLLRNAQIAAAITAGKQQQLQTADLSAVRVLEELRRLALIDARSFFDEGGNVKPIKDWTPEQGAALAGFEVIIKNAAAGDGHTDTVHKIKLWNKPQSLEMLAKHFALLTDVISVKGDAELVAFLQGARRRTENSNHD